MPWWALLYLAVLFALEIGSARLRRQLGVSWLMLALDLATIAGWALLVAAYFDAPLAERLGRAAIGLFAAALVWTGLSAHRDIALFEEHPDVPPDARHAADFVGILLTVLILTPAVGLGAIAAVRAW
jgi:hypothetical protein